jgi:IPT/TIG domain
VLRFGPSSGPTPSPAGAVDVLVTVRNPDGSQMTFTGQPYRYRAPFIATLSPSTGPVSGGLQGTISGFFFTPGASVTFDSVPAAVVSQSSDANTIVVTSPPGTRLGAVSVRVANSDGVGGTKNYAYTP